VQIFSFEPDPTAKFRHAKIFLFHFLHPLYPL
jgi:hypothetical protein